MIGCFCRRLQHKTIANYARFCSKHADSCYVNLWVEFWDQVNYPVSYQPSLYLFVAHFGVAIWGQLLFEVSVFLKVLDIDDDKLRYIYRWCSWAQGFKPSAPLDRHSRLYLAAMEINWFSPQLWDKIWGSSLGTRLQTLQFSGGKGPGVSSHLIVNAKVFMQNKDITCE